MIRGMFVLGTLLLLSACGKEEKKPEAPRASRLNVESGVKVPTQEEADRAAAASIDRRNFDAELQKLEREIDGDQ